MVCYGTVGCNGGWIESHSGGIVKETENLSCRRFVGELVEFKVNEMGKKIQTFVWNV